MLPFYNVDIVIFDCDSTLSAIEGIDELARRKGINKQLEPLTTAAMEGRMKLEDVYGQRLTLIRPDLDDTDWLGRRYIESIVSDAVNVIGTLQDAGKQVHIVSGGIRQSVIALAGYLGVEDSHTHAVELYFDSNGNYCGYDENSPLARTGGKKTMCRNIVKSGGKAVMIGDGITDLEAVQQDIDFIGFGGVICRRQVRENTRDFITGPGLSPLLQRLLK